MINKQSRATNVAERHSRVRKKIYGTQERPRLNVYRSESHIYAQLIDDDLGKTLAAASSIDKELKSTLKAGSNKEAAKLVGELIAKRASEKGISKVVFDRGGYIYHGRIKELADAARQGGLQF